MPRRRGPLRAPLDDRRLAEEVLYLHSLWRRGPSTRDPAPAPSQTHSARRRKRRRLQHPAADEPQDAGSEWVLAPSPPTSSPKAWPEAAAASASSPAKPTPPPSPGTLAQREALRAAAEFFSRRDSSSSSDGEEEGSESDGEEEEEAATGFFAALFERDAALRGHYESGWEERRFACMACAAERRQVRRRFRGCAALVQHATTATRYGRARAHPALAAAICHVLGWDIERLPTIVIDPRGKLGQELTAQAQEKVDTGSKGSLGHEDEEKEDAQTGMEDSSNIHGDLEDNEMEDDKESPEKEDVETGIRDYKNTDGDEEAKELENIKETAEKEQLEEMGETKVLCNETEQEVNGNRDDSLDQHNNGEVHEQEITEESSEQVNTILLYLPESKDACKNEEHAKEATVQEEVNATESEKEHTEIADDAGDTSVARLGNHSPKNAENKEVHVEATS